MIWLLEISFNILKRLSKTIQAWQHKSLDEIKKDRDIPHTIELFVLFWILQTLALDKGPSIRTKIDSEEDGLEEDDIKRIIVLLNFLLKLKKKNQKGRNTT